MDIQSQSTKPISDDQELAKVLAGVTGNMSFEPIPTPQSTMPAPQVELPKQTVEEKKDQEIQPIGTVSSANAGELEDIKQQALFMLRPLLDKLTITSEEKFDIYLLLLRSTDDKTLIDPAYKCAQSISDETRRAQALLDVIREIDFLSNPTKNED